MGKYTEPLDFILLKLLDFKNSFEDQWAPVLESFGGKADFELMLKKELKANYNLKDWEIAIILKYLKDAGYVDEFFNPTFKGADFIGFKNSIIKEKKDKQRDFRNIVFSGIAGTLLGLIPTILQPFQTQSPKYLTLDSLKIQTVHDTIYINVRTLKTDTSLVRLVKPKPQKSLR